MTKKAARPASSLGASRRLVGGEATVSQTTQSWHCLACAWRKFSNEGLKSMRAQHTDLPESYDGLVAGFKDGNIIVAQFVANKQIGFISIPIQNFESVAMDLVNTYQRATESIQQELDAKLLADGMVDEEGNLTEKGIAALGLTPEMVAEIEAEKAARAKVVSDDGATEEEEEDNDPA